VNQDIPMAASGDPSKAQFQTDFAHGILLTKYSRNNKPSEWLVYSRGGNRIAWRPPDAGQRFKQLLRPLTLSSSTTHSMIGLVYFHPGVPSADWFNGEVPPPPLSFAILTTTRLVRLTAPSVDVYVACLHGFEAILATQNLNNPQQTLRQPAPALTKQPVRSPLQASSSRARLLADGSVDMGVLVPQTPTSHTFDLPVPVDGFLALYDEVLASQSPLGMDTSTWEVISNSHDDKVNAGETSETTDSEVPCLSRQVRTQHMTTLKVPGFKNVTVAKTMAVFIPAFSQQSISWHGKSPSDDTPVSGFMSGSNGIQSISRSSNNSSDDSNKSSSSSSSSSDSSSSCSDSSSRRSSGRISTSSSTASSGICSSSKKSASLLVLEANRFIGAMYSDYFVVYARFVVTPIDPNTSGKNFGCTVTISTSIAFLNSTFLQSLIVAEFLRHSPWVYRRWAALALEHLDARTTSATLTAPSSLQDLIDSATNTAGGGISLTGENADEAVQVGARLDLGSTLRHSSVGRALSRAMAAHMHRDLLNPKTGTADELSPWLSSTLPKHAMDRTPAEAIEGFICPVCGNISNTQGGLMAHYTSNHMDDELHASGSDSSDGGDDDRSDDNQTKGSGSHADDEKSAALPLSAVEPPAVASGFVCPDCYSKFGSADELTLHYEIQHGNLHSHRTPSSLPGTNALGPNETTEDDESIGDAMVRDIQTTMDSVASLFTAEWTWETAEENS